MGPKLDQNNSLCQLSTKECSKFRDAVETGQAKVEDLPIIDREVNNSPGSGYVAIINKDGTARVNGFIAPVPEPSESVEIAKSAAEVGASMGSMDGLSGYELIRGSDAFGVFNSTPVGRSIIIDMHEAIYQSALVLEDAELASSTLDFLNREKFTQGSDEYFAETGDLSELNPLYEEHLKAKFRNFALETQGAQEWNELDLNNMPSVGDTALQFEADLRYQIEAHIDGLSGRKQAMARELLDGSRNLKDLAGLYFALGPF